MKFCLWDILVDNSKAKRWFFHQVMPLGLCTYTSHARRIPEKYVSGELATICKWNFTTADNLRSCDGAPACPEHKIALRPAREVGSSIWTHEPRSENGQSFTDISQIHLRCSELLLIVYLPGYWAQKLFSPATNLVNFINKLLMSSEDPIWQIRYLTQSLIK